MVGFHYYPVLITSGGAVVFAPAVTGRKQILHALLLTVDTDCTVTIHSSGGSDTALTGAMPVVASSGFLMPMGMMTWGKSTGWCKTLDGEGLKVTCSESAATGGGVAIVEVI